MGRALPLSGPQNEPAGQRRHDDTLLACITGLYVPALQFVGTALPLSGPQNEPAGHNVHATWETEPESGLNEPAGHSVQLAWPTTGLKKPEAHGEQKYEPMMEWDPTGHTVTMSTVLT